MSTYFGRCDCGNIEYEFQDNPINTVFFQNMTLSHPADR